MNNKLSFCQSDWRSGRSSFD